MLQKFKFEKVLSQDSITKTIRLLGLIDEKFAILILEKTTINIEAVQYDRAEFSHSNDVYHNYRLKSDDSLKITLIYPADDQVLISNLAHTQILSQRFVDG